MTSEQGIVFSGTPVNLFNSYQRKAHNSSDDTCRTPIPDVDLPENYVLSGFWHTYPSKFVNDKTIYDPNPAGYSLSGIFTKNIYRYNEINVRDKEIIGVSVLAIMLGTNDQKIGVTANGYTTYTTPSKNQQFTYPMTGRRNGDGSLEQVTSSSAYIIDSFWDNGVSFCSLNVGGKDLFDAGKLFGYNYLYGAAPVLPFDDEVRTSKDFAEHPFNYIIDEGPSGSGSTPSASSTLGRYTVMAADPGLR